MNYVIQPRPFAFCLFSFNYFWCNLLSFALLETDDLERGFTQRSGMQRVAYDGMFWLPAVFVSRSDQEFC